MSHEQAAQHHHAHHIPTRGMLLRTFTALTILMLLTVASKYVDFHDPIINNAINLGIAVAKATLVVTYFMGLKYASSLAKMFGLAGFVWLTLITITFGDYTTRQWEPTQGWYQADKGDLAPSFQPNTVPYKGIDNVGGEPSAVTTTP